MDPFNIEKTLTKDKVKFKGKALMQLFTNNVNRGLS
jgi:hypothetical protein